MISRRAFFATSAFVAAPLVLPGIAVAQDATPASSPAAVPAGLPESSPVAIVLPRYRELDFTPFDAALDALDSARIAELDALLPTATIPDLQNAMGAGELTAEELTLYFLNRIRTYDEVLRSYIELNPSALDDAKAADAARAAGEPLGPMAGIPVNLKDNIETAGPMHTTAGGIVLADHVAEQDALLVTSLREAGAVILGKASLSEFAGALNNPGANAMAGQGINPFGAGYATAGSSSGSAISTSALLTDVSVGSETSGSLIAPSAFNGVVGMKPSFGVVSGEGVVPLIRFNDSAGPIGRWVTDVATLLGAIDTTEVDDAAGLDAGAGSGKTAGLLRDDILNASPASGEYVADAPAIIERIEGGLAEMGASMVDVPSTMLDEQTAGVFTVYLIAGIGIDTVGYLAEAGAPATTLDEWIAFNLEDPSVRIPAGQPLLDAGQQAGFTAADYEQMHELVFAAATEGLEGAFAASNADVLVSVSNIHSQLYATAGYPAITVPVGLHENGQPAGATFIAKPGEDAALLAFAYAFEQATRLRQMPPVTETAGVSLHSRA